MLEGHRDDHDGRQGGGLAVLIPADIGAGNRLAHLLRRGERAVGLARADHHPSSRLGKTQRQAQTLIPGATQDRYRISI